MESNPCRNYPDGLLSTIQCFQLCSGVLSTIQFAYQEGLGICDAFVCMSHALQSALKSRQEARIVQIDFCTAFDRVNHQWISSSSAVWELEVLCCLFWYSFSNRAQNVVVDGCRSKLVNVVSVVLRARVLGLQLFLLLTEELFSTEENKFYGYADDTILVAVVPSPGERVAVTESMNRDQNRVSVWCNLGEWNWMRVRLHYDSVKVKWFSILVLWTVDSWVRKSFIAAQAVFSTGCLQHRLFSSLFFSMIRY